MRALFESKNVPSADSVSSVRRSSLVTVISGRVRLSRFPDEDFRCRASDERNLGDHC